MTSFAGVLFSLFAQQSDFTVGNADLDGRYAREEFRIGVQAYNRFAFNEAIFSFERALSFRPGESLLLDWLGRAYYRSGFEEAAIRQWVAASGGYEPMSTEALLLKSRVETIRNRRNLLPIADDNIRYVESGRYPGVVDKQTLYRQPTAALPLEDGSVWVVAYGSNELVRIDPNGIVRQRQRGPLNGFDRPYDLVRGYDGRLYVSEYRGGRVSVLNSNGDWQSYIGSKGRGDGMFVGPQNLAVDESGYLYVVDYGNRRVSKFDPDGAFVLSFGRQTVSASGEAFGGLLSPTGIAAKDGRVYVADNTSNQIYLFDPNGAYLGVLISSDLLGPESLRFLSDGRLLVADRNRVIMIDVDSAVVRELGVPGNDKVRLVDAGMDRNGNILVVNFQASEVSIMTRLDDMASGLFVQIERVVASAFPQVTVEVSVQDRLRRPVVGLDARNFLLSEEGNPVSRQQLLGAGYRTTNFDLSLLIERSPATGGLRENLNAAVRDISSAGGAIVSLVSASALPVKEQMADGIPLGAAAGGGEYSPRWRFDLGLRLAATDLLAADKKRAVVFVGSGVLGELAFEQYGLSELAAYLANNGIVFYAVIVGGGQADAALEYLASQTGGQVLPLYRNEGVKPVIQSLVSVPNGVYIISYESRLPTDFGNAYLPVEAEAYLLARSGRDKTGYFPPLN
ncbi:MAG: NHL repeat-containing protein [Treponema sp.]|jgi:DNA-binding beta-propeller fold protein YncE|nr:NHL repeat-containing protein [Treponema sp.]